jgi:hypothetical protein
MVLAVQMVNPTRVGWTILMALVIIRVHFSLFSQASHTLWGASFLLFELSAANIQDFFASPYSGRINLHEVKKQNLIKGDNNGSI